MKMLAVIIGFATFAGAAEARELTPKERYDKVQGYNLNKGKLLFISQIERLAKNAEITNSIGTFVPWKAQVAKDSLKAYFVTSKSNVCAAASFYDLDHVVDVTSREAGIDLHCWAEADGKYVFRQINLVP